MSETLIAALIGAAPAVIVCIINNISQNRRFEQQMQMQREESEAKQEETLTLIDYRLEQIEKKQDRHNNLIERVYKVEKRIGIDEEKLNNSIEKIHELAEYHKP